MGKVLINSAECLDLPLLAAWFCALSSVSVSLALGLTWSYLMGTRSYGE